MIKPLPVLLSAFAAVACTRAIPPDPAAVPDGGRWDYAIDIPADFERVPVQGIDSKVEQWRGPAATIGTDFGMYAGRAECHDGSATCRQWHERIDGRDAEITRDANLRPGGPVSSLNLYMPIGGGGPTGTTLGVIVDCQSAAACDRALGILRTIRIFRAAR